jgi:hypothetical protein
LANRCSDWITAVRLAPRIPFLDAAVKAVISPCHPAGRGNLDFI